MKVDLFPKQEAFMLLDKRINVFAGGIQSSKSFTGALRFVLKGLLTFRHPEDNFIIGADNYKTLYQATIPRFLKFARPYGTMNWAKMEFVTHWGTHTYFRTGTHPESFEGIDKVRRGWLDEGGKCSRYFYENVDGRCAATGAPLDVTTTPYAMNWLPKMCKDARAGKRDDVGLVHCKSIESPYFNKDEYLRQKKILDPRRFAMKYDGEFGQMQGLVFDRLQLCRSFLLPEGTVYYAGVDWGYHPDPFALVIRALTPQKKHYRVAEYYKTYLTITDVVNVVKQFNGLYKFRHVVCDPSQPAHIEEMSRHGLPAVPANNDLRFGIDVHYNLMREGRFQIFEDMNPLGIDEYQTYHYAEERELAFDEARREKETLPVDANNHGVDADRYLSVFIERRETVKRAPVVPHDPTQRPDTLEKRIAWLKAGGSSSRGMK